MEQGARNYTFILANLDFYIHAFFVGLELSLSLLRVIIAYMLIVLILSRLTRTIIALVKEVIAKPKRFLTVQIERFVNEVDNKDRGRVLPIFSCLLSLLPLLVVCCFFGKEFYQETSLGYTNLVVVIKIIYGSVHFYMGEIYTSWYNFMSALNAVYNSIKSYFIGVLVELKTFCLAIIMYHINNVLKSLFFIGRVLMFQYEMFKILSLFCASICQEAYAFSSFYVPKIASALYALFCGYASDINRDVSGAFYNSMFNHIYVASCAIYVALCEADMALSEESLSAKNVVFERRLGRHSIMISYCYPAVIQMLLRVSVCLGIFLFCWGIFLFIKRLAFYAIKAYVYWMLVRRMAKLKKELESEKESSLKQSDSTQKSINDDVPPKKSDFFTDGSAPERVNKKGPFE